MSKATLVDGDVLTQARVQQLLYGNANGESADDLTKLAIKHVPAVAEVFSLELDVPETLTADKVLTLRVNDADRTINLTGNLVLAGNLTTTGAFNTIFAQTASVTLTLPAANDTLVGRDVMETLTQKTLTTPDINGGTVDALTSLGIRSTGAAQDMKIATTAVYTGTRTLTVNIPVDGNAALTLVGDLVTTGGAFNLTLTMTGHTNITLPTAGTLVNTAVTTLAALVSVGTIGTGVWQGTEVGAAYGGTGLTTITDHSVMLGSGVGAVTPLAVGATGTILTGVTGGDPAWTTATYPATTTINRILFSSANNVVDQIATAVSGILVTSGAGVPSIAVDIPTAVTIGGAYVYRAAGTDVAVADGGTGLSAYVVGDIIHATAAGTLAGLADVAVGSVLVSGGIGVIAAWATDIPTAVTIGAAYIYRAAGTDIPVTDGGTGLSAFAVGDILQATAATTIGGLADVAVGSILVSGGVGVVAAWATDIPTAVTIGAAYIYRAAGTDVAVADGGTNMSAWAIGDIVHATAATTLAGLADVAVGSVLVSGGVGVIPAWATDIPTAVTIGAAYIYRAAGTDVPVTDGGTGLSAFAIGDILHATAATTIGGLADVAVGSILVSGGVGVVAAWATDIPTAVTIGAAYIYRVGGADIAVADGGTNMGAYTIGDILHATAAGTLAGLADVAVGAVLCSGGAGVIAAWSTTPTFTSSVQTGRGEVGRLNFKDETALVMDANGEITTTQTTHNVDTWGGGASDDLQGIIGGLAGDILIIRPLNAARTVVAKHAGAPTAGVALNLAAGVDFTMDEDNDFLMLIHDGALWQEIGRSENHA